MTKAGRTLKELGYVGELWKIRLKTDVKTPVFSFAKMSEVDISLGSEIRSTGEVMGLSMLIGMGYKLLATVSTAEFLHNSG